LPTLLQLYVAMMLLLGAPLDALVDRQHELPGWYAPGLSQESFEAWSALQQAAVDEGLKLVIFSGYRSYEYQAEVYEREVSSHQERANWYTARPGHSEHQLGTAFDVAWPGVALGADDQRNERIYAWLKDHAHRFGFVISYPYKEGEVWPYNNRWMPMVSEYIQEPWHIRYVGTDLAERIYSAGYLDPLNPILPQDFLSPWP
jgi:D-alanyl-D-alanine carboxypeptidase